uniref:Secreted protein n=1 Tax=Aegilops tauschii subsp. strangulata TaxID=200361 RepID=A0A453MCS4_AEGTS
HAFLHLPSNMASTCSFVLVLGILCFGLLALPASSVGATAAGAAGATMLPASSAGATTAGAAGASMQLREDLRLMEIAGCSDICQACLVHTFQACFDFRPARFAAYFIKYIVKEKCIGM